MNPSQPTPSDEKMMRLALKEARKGFGNTSPNPAVGAVLVKNGRVIARGWHRAAGCPHAEIEALRALKKPSAAKGATIYITLEPCSTHGRTPPCSAAIIESGITRVVYGARDPNPKHAGRADEILRQSGIEVVSGVLEAECESLNRAWNKWIRTGLPYVIAKTGMSLDGRIGSPKGRRWITSEASRKDAMKIRAASGAILVGAETVRTDNPSLTVRNIPVKQQPLRVVWSRSGNLPPDCHLLSDEYKERTLVFQGKSLKEVLLDLGQRGVEQVLIEGGGRTLGEAFDEGLVDRVVFYVAPLLIGGETPSVAGSGAADNETAIRMAEPSYKRIGDDIRIEGAVDYSPRFSSKGC
jgi:diaminohydroxyphosphoribosylaminopyrimidine deaminase/5-amino-6-(5-phosphoribosylamino)uracil reductase